MQDLILTNGEHIKELVLEAKIPFKKLISIEQSKLKPLVIFSKKVAFLINKDGMPLLDALLELEPPMLQKLFEKINLDMYSKSDIEEYPFFQLQDFRFLYENSSIKMIDLLKITPLTTRHELLEKLNWTLKYVNKLIPLDDIIHFDSSERSELFENEWKLSILIKKINVSWSTINNLEPRIRSQVIQHAGLIEMFINKKQLSFDDVLLLIRRMPSPASNYLYNAFDCLGPNRMSVDELISLEATVRDELFQNVSEAEKKILSTSDDVRQELYGSAYFIAPFKGEMNNLIKVLSTMDQSTRNKVYTHWSIIQKLVNDGHVPCHELSSLSLMNPASIAELEHPNCLHALANKSIRFPTLASMSTEQLKLANDNNFSEISESIDHSSHDAETSMQQEGLTRLLKDFIENTKGKYQETSYEFACISTIKVILKDIDCQLKNHVIDEDLSPVFNESIRRVKQIREDAEKNYRQQQSENRFLSFFKSPKRSNYPLIVMLDKLITDMEKTLNPNADSTSSASASR